VARLCYRTKWLAYLRLRHNWNAPWWGSGSPAPQSCITAQRSHGKLGCPVSWSLLGSVCSDRFDAEYIYLQILISLMNQSGMVYRLASVAFIQCQLPTRAGFDSRYRKITSFLLHQNPGSGGCGGCGWFGMRHDRTFAEWTNHDQGTADITKSISFCCFYTLIIFS
jgi:hypothetical protein